MVVNSKRYLPPQNGNFNMAETGAGRRNK